MNDLDVKINRAFPGRAVRKDLVQEVRGNASVPSYVLEYLLGQNCATDDEQQIATGVQRVRDILEKHYVQRGEAGLWRSNIKQEGYRRVIDKVSVELNTKRDAYEAAFENLGISHVLVGSEVVKENPRLLVTGVWCIADLSYMHNEAKDESPFILTMLKPIQMGGFDLDEHVRARAAFSTEEWIDVVVRSVGINPATLSHRSKLLQLVRLIPYCERNYNLIELGPKGTGKSHVYSEFSPHGILISGGEVTPAKLFVNNSNGRIGLVGYWDCVAFDEFAGKNKRPKSDIVDILKNYMANKSFSRGIEQVTAEASMAFEGNTAHDVSYMVRNTDLFEDLPAVYHDPAFIDRLHAYIPGWEMDILRGDMFCTDFGLIVDYLAEALRALRPLDYSGLYGEHFELSPSLSARDRDGVRKTFSGLMKIIFPGKDATKEEERELLEFSMELRERVKDQLYRIDGTYERVEFSYRDLSTGEVRRVATLEEVEHGRAYHALDLVPWEQDGEGAAEPADGVGKPTAAAEAATEGSDAAADASREPAAEDGAEPAAGGSEPQAPELFAGHREYRESQRGITYDQLFGDYLEGATSIRIVDPYVITYRQCRNLMEFMQVVLRRCALDQGVAVHLITKPDEHAGSRQAENLDQMVETFAPYGIDFSWEFDQAGIIHARHICIDSEWDIGIDRGLDIFQWYETDDFHLESWDQGLRRVKQFEVDYRRCR